MIADQTATAGQSNCTTVRPSASAGENCEAMRRDRYLMSDPPRRLDIGNPLFSAVVEVRPNMIEKMVRHVTNPQPAGGASGERDDRQAPASSAASRHRAWARLRYRIVHIFGDIAQQAHRIGIDPSSTAKHSPTHRARTRASVPRTIMAAAMPKPNVGDPALHSTPTAELETNLAVPLTVPRAP